MHAKSTHSKRHQGSAGASTITRESGKAKLNSTLLCATQKLKKPWHPSYTQHMHYCKTTLNPTIRSHLYRIVLKTTSKHPDMNVTKANDTGIKCVRESSKHQYTNFQMSTSLSAADHTEIELRVTICIL